MEDLKEVDLSIVEQFRCPVCNCPNYARISVITMEPSVIGEDAQHRYHMPEYLTCRCCGDTYDITEHEVDNGVHFGFTCDNCGLENIQTQPSVMVNVRCMACFDLMKAGYTNYMRNWLRIAKPSVRLRD